MRKPRLDRFDSSRIEPETIDLSGVPEIREHNAARPVSTTTTAPQDHTHANLPALSVEPESVGPSHRADGDAKEAATGRPNVRTPVRTVHRTKARYSFEFFRDQIESLRQFSLEEKMQGEAGNMSEMVREAIDAYLAKRNRTD